MNPPSFMQCMNGILKPRANIHILGDFNINYLNKRTEAMKHLRHFEVSTGLNQLIRKETRYDSCIDLIYSNSDIISNSGVLNVSLSDHNVIFVSSKKGKEPFKTIRFTGRSYVDYDKEVFQQALVEQDWTCFDSCIKPEDCWMTMKTIIEKKINSMCPIKTRLIKDKGEPWIDHDILVKIHDKKFYYRTQGASVPLGLRHDECI